MDSRLEHAVFVYGTLKRGLYNYHRFLAPAEAQGKAAFVGAARTVAADFHLVVDPEYHVPCMYHAPGGDGGYQVPGELFRVDSDTLAELDLLEGVEHGWYVRETLQVELLDGPHKGVAASCFGYAMPLRDELLAFPRIREYSGDHKALRLPAGVSIP